MDNLLARDLLKKVFIELASSLSFPPTFISRRISREVGDPALFHDTTTNERKEALDSLIPDNPERCRTITAAGAACTSARTTALPTRDREAATRVAAVLAAVAAAAALIRRGQGLITKATLRECTVRDRERKRWGEIFNEKRIAQR